MMLQLIWDQKEQKEEEKEKEEDQEEEEEGEKPFEVRSLQRDIADAEFTLDDVYT